MTVLNLNHFGMDQLFVKLFQDNNGVLYSKGCQSKGQEPFLTTNHTKK